MRCLGLAGAFVVVMTACSSPKVSERGLNPPQAVQVLRTSGFQTRTARVEYGQKNLIWSNEWVRLRNDQELKAGDIVRTPNNGFLTLILPPTFSTLTVFPGSTLAFEQLEQSGVSSEPSIARLYLQEGRLQVQSHLRDSNSVEEVRTPFGVAR